MKQETYLKLYRRAAKAAPALEWTNRLITWGVYAWFTGWMIWLFLFYRHAFWPAFFTMGVSFVLVSVFRRIFNAPRPYEVFSVPPLMRKDTHGQSFPSRHVFSIFIIAAVTYWLYPLPGAILFAAGVVLAFVRVVTGVHFLRDVAAGAVCGLVMGFAGMAWLLPLF